MGLEASHPAVLMTIGYSTAPIALITQQSLSMSLTIPQVPPPLQPLEPPAYPSIKNFKARIIIAGVSVVSPKDTLVDDNVGLDLVAPIALIISSNMPPHWSTIETQESTSTKT